jgi:cysteine-rich repeat protein
MAVSAVWLVAMAQACSHAWEDYDPNAPGETTGSTTGAGGAATTGAGGSGAGTGAGSVSAGGMGGGVSATSVGGTGGGGGSQNPFCGDGTIDVSEECDDGNTASGDGCVACTVECAAAGEFEDPDTHVCYWHLPGPGFDWAGASAACNVWGGYLATVTTADELELIRSHVTVRSWLGGNELAAEGTWVWHNGEPWSFEAWLTGEPNNAFGTKDEDCLELYDNMSDMAPSGFADRDCIAVARAVCERLPPSG